MKNVNSHRTTLTYPKKVLVLSTDIFFFKILAKIHFQHKETIKLIYELKYESFYSGVSFVQ